MSRAAFLGSSLAALAASPAAFAQAGPPTPSSDAPVEVTVHGTKPSAPVGANAVSPSDARAIPGTFGDAFQALAALPGLAPMASGLPFFYVRGAPPADTGYFIDGIPVPTLFHIGPGASIVPQALVDHVDFFPGAAPARYGRFVGGIIAGQTTEPRPVARGEASVRLFDASAFVEQPLGEASSVAVGGRYGYPNLLLSIFAPTLSLHFGDYTFRWTRSLSDADRISLFALGAYDHEEDKTQSLVPIDSQFHRIDLRYDHKWASGSVRVATTFGYDRTTGNVPADVAETVTSTSARFRFELLQRLGSGAELSAGADAVALHYGVDDSERTTTAVGAEEVAGAYADLTLHLLPGVDLLPSLRIDEYHPSSGLPGPASFAFDPKLAARVALSSRVTWVSTLGIAHQEPSYVVPIPGLRITPNADGLQKVYSIAEGAEVRLPGSLKARVTGFLQADRAVSDFVATCGASLACTSVASVDGSTYGLELLIERALTRRLGGWLSYTLSRAQRVLDNMAYLSPFDRTHVVSVVVHYDLGRGYGAGLRGTYYTGRPDVPPVAVATTVLPLASDQRRLPDYYRLDARLDKRWNLGRGRWLTAVAEFFDATLTKEAVDYKCNFVTRLCVAEYVGPIALPSVGLEGGF
jgi:TonB-dependent Receptor Plug Domain